MVDIVDVRIGREGLIEFITAEGSRLIELHRHLRSMYGKDATDVSS
jgi:hypothetical protein